MISERERNIIAQFQIRNGICREEAVNQDLQVLIPLMKVDYLSLNTLMIDLEIEDATKLQLVNIFTSVADIS